MTTSAVMKSLLALRYFGVAFALWSTWILLTDRTGCLGEITPSEHVQIIQDYYILGPLGFMVLLLLPWSRIRPGVLWWLFYAVLVTLGFLWFRQLKHNSTADLAFVAAFIAVQAAILPCLRQFRCREILRGPQFG